MVRCRLFPQALGLTKRGVSVEWLSGWYNWPFLFVLAFGLLFIILDLLLGGLSDIFGGIGGVDTDVDVDADPGIETDGGHGPGGFMAWLGMGRVPLTIVLETLSMTLLARLHDAWPLGEHDIRVQGDNLLPLKDHLTTLLRAKQDHPNAPRWLKKLVLKWPSGGVPLTIISMNIRAKTQELEALRAKFQRVSETIGWEDFYPAGQHIEQHHEPYGDQPTEVRVYQELCWELWIPLQVIKFREDWFLVEENDTCTTANQETLEALVREFPPPELPSEDEIARRAEHLDAILDEMLS